MTDLVFSTYNLKRNRSQNIRAILEHVAIVIASVVMALVIGMEYIPA